MVNALPQRGVGSPPVISAKAYDAHYEDQALEREPLPDVAEHTTSAQIEPGVKKLRVWVYYNPTTGEATLYEDEPPERFGRREHDIGPIELDEDLIRTYVAAKSVWSETHATFIAAVKAACVPLASLDDTRLDSRD